MPGGNLPRSVGNALRQAGDGQNRNQDAHNEKKRDDMLDGTHSDNLLMLAKTHFVERISSVSVQRFSVPSCIDRETASAVTHDIFYRNSNSS